MRERLRSLADQHGRRYEPAASLADEASFYR
jgi:hypothetical protein